MAYSVIINNVDFTQYVPENTISIDESITTRATTLSFIANTNIIHQDPDSYAFKNVFVYHDTVKIFGGFVVALNDVSTSLLPRMKVECHDFTQYVDLKLANEVYVNKSDTYIIHDLLTKYVTWVDASHLGSSTTTIPREIFNRITVLAAIRRICNLTNRLFYIDFDKKASYIDPNSGSNAPYNISDTPNGLNTFPAKITTHKWDYTSLTNSVTALGGYTRSKDTTDNLYPQIDGIKTCFWLTYRPKPSSVIVNGNHIIEVKRNGTRLKCGFDNSNQFSDGYDCLVNTAEKLLKFPSALSTSTTSSLTIKYQYDIPINVVVKDPASYAKYGDWIEGKVYDSRIYDAAVAQLRAQAIIEQEKDGKEQGAFLSRFPGLRVGNVIHIKNNLRHIDGDYLINKISVRSDGNNCFWYNCSYGAYNQTIIDHVARLNTLLTPEVSIDSGSIEGDNEEDIVTRIYVANETAHATLVIDACFFDKIQGPFYPGYCYPGFSVSGA